MRGISFVRAWLESRRPYHEGLALLLANHPGLSPHLQQLLQAETPFTRKKLRAELELLATEQQLVASRPARAQGAATSIPAPAASIPAPAADQLVELRRLRLADFKRAAYLKSRLELMSSDDERFTAACEIRQLWRNNAKSWDDEAYFLEHGYLPPENSAAPALDLTNIGAVTTRRNTLRTYISGQRGSAEKRATWAAELLQLNRILDDEPV